MPTPDARRLLADALWAGVRHEPALPTADGVRGWYLDHVFAPVARARRSRIWTHRSPEPWLTAQWALTRLGGASVGREDLRYEGLPGGHSYERAYQDVAAGLFDAPYLFVAGYSRTGTTSLQNTVMWAFPEHLQPGRWADPGHPVRLWWFPKHRDFVARRIAALDPAVARALVTVRPAVPSVASLAVYRGYWRPDDIALPWLRAEVDAWCRMTEVALLPSIVPVDFPTLVESTPRELADCLADRLGIPAVGEDGREPDWTTLSASGISPDVMDDPQLSNMPSPQRRAALEAVSDRIMEVLGDEMVALDELYQRAAARAITVVDAGLDSGTSLGSVGGAGPDHRESAGR